MFLICACHVLEDYLVCALASSQVIEHGVRILAKILAGSVDMLCFSALCLCPYEIF